LDYRSGLSVLLRTAVGFEWRTKWVCI